MQRIYLISAIAIFVMTALLIGRSSGRITSRTFCLTGLAIAAVLVVVWACWDKNGIPAEHRAILEQAEEIEVLSLMPDHLSDPPPDGYHGFKVLGKTTVNDAAARKRLVTSFEKGVDIDGTPFRCFNPRHGIRATHDGQTADFVICFECSYVQTFLNGAQGRTFAISNSPAAAFDEVLKKANVPLAEKAK
jgi:hypothetical protein